MADPTQLQSQIYQTFGQGVTGVGYDKIAEGLEKDRNYKRQQLESLYDVGAELDAGAYKALQGELNNIYDKIDSNELIAGTPEFRAAQRKLTAYATDLKQTQDLMQSTLAEATANPDKFSYIVQDESGNPVDLGFQGIVDNITNFATNDFKGPTDYINKGAQTIGSLRPKADENAVRMNVQKSIDDVVKKKLDSMGIDEMDIKQQYLSGARNLLEVYRNLAPTPEALGSLQTEIKETVKNQYGDQLSLVAATRRGQGAFQGDNDTFIQEYVNPMIQTGMSEVDQVAKPAPRAVKEGKNLSIRSSGSGWENDDFMFDPISETEVAVNSKGSSEPNKVWRGVDELGGEEGQQGEKKSLTSVVFKDGKFYAKLVGENLMEPILVDFDKNGKLLEDFYGITKDSARKMLGMTETQEAEGNNETLMGLGNPFPTDSQQASTPKKKLP